MSVEHALSVAHTEFCCNCLADDLSHMFGTTNRDINIFMGLLRRSQSSLAAEYNKVRVVLSRLDCRNRHIRKQVLQAVNMPSLALWLEVSSIRLPSTAY